MSNQAISRQNMLNTFESLKDKFADSLRDAKKQEREFEVARANFEQKMAEHIEKSSRAVAEGNPLKPALDKINDTLKSINQTWNQKIEQQDKGVSFRSGFNDSLLIFVYGKVKSGKSSLGNYMAWGHTDPTDELKQQTAEKFHPEYFSHERTDVKSGDAEKEAEKNKSFRVGATEATSSIQGFKLSGLTWVDSPGLHSNEEANGKLAQDYVKNSDLVLYTMKSDSPGRSTDIKEILDLCEDDKKLVLLITGSDDTELDEDEHGNVVKQIVMKDSERRQKQIDYVRQALADALIERNQAAKQKLTMKADDIEIISFSARYAQLHESDEHKFYDSGMGRLFATINQIATAEGVKLKQQVPMQNFSNFIDKFANSDMQDFETALTDLQNPVRELERKAATLVREEASNIRKLMSQFVDSEFEDLEDSRDDASLIKGALGDLQDTLRAKHRSLVDDAVSKIVSELLSSMDKELTQSIQYNEMLSLPEFEIRTRRVREDVYHAGNKRTAAATGAAAGAAVGAAIGSAIPVVGTFFGGVAGGLLGGLFGGSAGRADRIEPTYIEVPAGDNLSTIKRAVKDQLEQTTNSQMEAFKQQLIDTAVKTAEILEQDIKKEIELFQGTVKSIQQEIAKTLN